MDQENDPIAQALAPYAPPKEDPILSALSSYEPPKTAPASEDTPSFWGDVKQATMFGAAQATEQGREFVQAAGRRLGGGAFFPNQEQREQPDILPPQVSPETDKEVRELLAQPVSQGWSNPRWWASHAMAGVTGQWPQLATGAVGTLFGGPPGGVVGYAGSTGALSLVPNFKAAKARGLDDGGAITNSLVDSGIDTAVAASMGIIPGTPIVRDQVRRMAVGPVREALVHMGLVLPAIGETGSQVKSLVDEGTLRGPDEIMTDWASGLGGNMILSAAHAIVGRVGDAVRAPRENTVRIVFGDVTHTEVPELRFESQMGIGGSRLDDLGFYSQVRKVIEDTGPNAAPAHEWSALLANASGVKQEELSWLRIPQFLADADGKVSKADLLEHVEGNALRLEERQLTGDDALHPTYVLPGEKTNYKETLIKIPNEQVGDIKTAQEEYKRAVSKYAANPEYELTPDLRGFRHRETKQVVPEVQNAYQRMRLVQRDSVFDQGHFDPNTLAHVRTTDRIDRDGKRTRVIEEIQSDWHQRGRKQGYKGENLTGEESRRMADIEWRLHETYAQLRQKFGNSRVGGPELTDEENAHISALRHMNEERDPRKTMQNLLDRGLVSREEATDYLRLHEKERVHYAGVPDAPFKQNWPELVFKRLLRQAADEGIERVVWTNGEQQIDRYGRSTEQHALGLDDEQQMGMRKFYDEIIPKIAQKYAKQLGMEMGKTRLVSAEKAGYPDYLLDAYSRNDPLGSSGAETLFRARPELREMRYLDLNPAAKTRIGMGFPLFNRPAGKVTIEGDRGYWRQPEEATKGLVTEAKRAVNALGELAKRMGINVPLTVKLERGSGRLGMLTRDQDGYHMHLDVSLHHNAADMYATLAHEFGHLIHVEHLEHAPWNVQQSIILAWQKWKDDNVKPTAKLLDATARRDNAVTEYYRTRQLEDIPFNALTPERARYWSGFEEWFAEQTARWATTDLKPLNVVDRFFQGLAEQLEKIRAWLSKATGIDYHADKFVAGWLNSFIDGGAPPFAANIYGAARVRSQQRSQTSLDRDGGHEITAVEVTPSTLTTRGAIYSALGGGVPPGAAADAAHADRMSKAYEHLTSLPQIAEMNPHITPLQYYKEGLGLFNAKIRQDHEAPLAILASWKKLHGPAADGVTGLIDDWANMRYLSEEDVKNGTKRMPTEKEFRKLVDDNGVSEVGIRVFQQVAKHVDSKLDEVGRILKKQGEGIADQAKRAEFNKSIDESIAEERKGPYFPFFHDGDYTVEVRGALGETIYYGRARTKKEQNSLAKKLTAGLEVGEEVKTGFLAKDARPLGGIPGSMLDAIAHHLSLSDSQMAAVAKLKVEQKPQIAMIRRVRPKILSPGYSSDFIRSYASYAFHTSRYFARTEWSPLFRGWIRQVRNLEGGVKLDQIANFMQKHYSYIMDPKPDFAALRGLIFNLRLGFSPTTAALYLTQTPLGTLPWLGKHFGDVRALASIARASAQRYNYYKSGKLLATTEAQLKAQREAMRNYVLDGGVAPELAGIAENANLTSNSLRGSLARGWGSYQQAAGTLLHLADTWNRRIAFDAAWHAAMAKPDAPYLRRAIEANPMEYQRLLTSGWTAQEAAAYVAGKHTVEQTHFVYQRSHRPQIMWGKSSALLMFQFWKQNMLFTLWNYPGVRMRSLMVMAGMGGLMGMPFAKDLQGLIQMIGWQVFSKDWNLEREIREYVLEHWGPDKEQLADSLLHGGERYGMGIPTVLDLLGHHVGMPKLPTVDRSSAIGLGDVLPVNLGDVLGPNRDQAGAGFRAAQDVAGAAFGYPFDLYKFLTDTKLNWNDVKKWEPIIPHWMSNASKAYRWYSEGVERDRNGNPVARFDVNDTTQAMEILARGLGYTPTRLSQQYDRRSAEIEVKTYWQLRREILMRQAWDARRVSDMDQFNRVASAIRTFNTGLPQEMRGSTVITATQLREFMQGKAKAAAMARAGLPGQKKDIPLANKMRQMYPVLDESQIGVR